jgi:uncharacterized membrane protein
VVFTLFLPGLAWSVLLFKKGEIDLIERIALSFGLSIAIVPLTVFYFNWFLGVRINLLNVSLITSLLIVIPLAILLARRLFSGRIL